MFVPKPATYIAYDQTQSITFSRVSGAVSALSTFDITVLMKNGAGSSQFSNINREDLKALETFFKLKGLRVKNEIDEDANLLAAALREEAMDDSDEEVVNTKGADRGSADEDEESVDEDFQADSDSDVAEEYDSAHESDGSGTGSEQGESDVDADADEVDDDDEEEEEERPKKKKRTD
jgi:structure-specific recognition protein 1